PSSVMLAASGFGPAHMIPVVFATLGESQLAEIAQPNFRLGSKVWRDYTGRGVHVGVFDEGVQSVHWDLSANYDASRHVVINGVTYAGDAVPGSHGTAVSGLIAAALNDRGGVGVAYNAKVTGVNIFDPASPISINNGSLILEALAQINRYDITNHSYGGAGAIGSVNSRNVVGTASYLQSFAVEFAAATGRGGLGTIAVAAAGNDGLDGQADGWKTDRHTVTISAYREADGAASSYSTRGAHLLVAAPSNDLFGLNSAGLITTDLLGTAGYNTSFDPTGPADYTDQFGGTSGATPVASGVVALMLDANEQLGWRDVKNILAASAKMPVAFETGPVLFNSEIIAGNFVIPFNSRFNESSFQLSGDAAGWNGGAMHYSSDYGYGAIDAYNAVRMAEVWSLFGSAKTSANEVAMTTGVIAAGVTTNGRLLDNATTAVQFFNGFLQPPVSYKFNVAESMDVEHLDLNINFETFIQVLDAQGVVRRELFTVLGLTQLKLIAPDGTEGMASIPGTVQSVSRENANQDYVMGFSGFRGVETKGEWTLQFQTYGESNDNGPDSPFTYTINRQLTINSLKLDMFGSTPSTDDVHSYTGEFFTMAGIAGEDGRRTLSDTNGGTDWINAAAVAANVEVSLIEGVTTRFGGRDAFTIARGSRIENVVTGDGADRLTGNVADNALYGMRGNDWLNGGAGNDKLFGGAGSDTFAFDTQGVSGFDRILDWSGGDRIATTKQLRGADLNGLITVGSNALMLLDNSVRGDTAELVGEGGAVLRAAGRSDGYWWYDFVSGGREDFTDGRVMELASVQAGAATTDGGALPGSFTAALGAATLGHAFEISDAAFFLYDTMGDAMSSGAVTLA
ncbi:S8 family serine peptidase, partial [Sphingomonas sp. 2R-10]|uniref:S8 family serine peptidase n=1 Tax=Sphingomonas sp. 2R-10 TaxID=3045148 RepID=UPI0024B95B40